MKKLCAVLLMTLVALFAATVATAQDSTDGLAPYRAMGQAVASAYGKWQIPAPQGGNFAAGAATITWPSSFCNVAVPGKSNFFPFATNAPVQIYDAVSANTEVVTPSAVSYTSAGCSIAISTSNAHDSYSVRSGTAGLQEAINDLASGTVLVTPGWAALGGTTAMITAAVGPGAAVASSNISIIDTRAANPVYYYLQPTTLTALATPATRSASAGATQVISGTATGTWTAAATYVCVTYVDALGGESPCSATYNFTATVNVALNFAAPAASTGAVGWRAYAGASYAAAYQLPISATTCTLSTLETLYPACAMGAAGVFPTPTTTTALHPGYVVNTYNPNTQSHTTSGYIASATPPLGPLQAHYGPFIASAGGTTGQIEVLGTVPLPSGYLNSIGKSIRIWGKITMTAGASETPVLKVMLGPTFTTGTPTAICALSHTTALSAAVYGAYFSCTVTTNATGASGTLMPDGLLLVQLGAGTTIGNLAVDTGTAAITNKLDTVNSIYVVYVPTSGTNSAAQLLDLHVESLN